MTAAPMNAPTSSRFIMNILSAGDPLGFSDRVHPNREHADIGRQELVPSRQAGTPPELHEWLSPAVIWVASLIPVTLTGVDELVVVPLPNSSLPSS